MASASPFFLMLLDPTAPHLPLPPDFVTKHLENKIPKDPIIISTNGSWPLKIIQVGKSYCFSHGWSNVVEDNKLGFGDFLVFWYIDQSYFKILVLSPNGCDKELDDGDPLFEIIINKGHQNLLRFPTDFMGLAGLDGERMITLKNLEGKEWQVSLRLDKLYKTTKRYCLSAGWTGFRKSNNLSEGDECVFKFIRSEGKLCLAKLVKTKLSDDALGIHVAKPQDERPPKR